MWLAFLKVSINKIVIKSMGKHLKWVAKSVDKQLTD